MFASKLILSATQQNPHTNTSDQQTTQQNTALPATSKKISENRPRTKIFCCDVSNNFTKKSYTIKYNNCSSEITEFSSTFTNLDPKKIAEIQSSSTKEKTTKTSFGLEIYKLFHDCLESNDFESAKTLFKVGFLEKYKQDYEKKCNTSAIRPHPRNRKCDYLIPFFKERNVENEEFLKLLVENHIFDMEEIHLIFSLAIQTSNPTIAEIAHKGGALACSINLENIEKNNGFSIIKFTKEKMDKVLETIHPKWEENFVKEIADRAEFAILMQDLRKTNHPPEFIKSKYAESIKEYPHLASKCISGPMFEWYEDQSI